MSPEKVNNKFISLGDWQLDISGTIYKKANPVEVIEGWQFLLDKNIPIDVYTKAFLITSLYTLLPDVLKNDVEVHNQIKVSNLLEPELSELVLFSHLSSLLHRLSTLHTVKQAK